MRFRWAIVVVVVAVATMMVGVAAGVAPCHRVVVAVAAAVTPCAV